MATTWVFGYGSLVSTTSLAATLGRPVRPGEGWAEAVLHGYGRRWNYGVGHTRGRLAGARGTVTIVALGVVAASGESANGVLVAVDAAELARLDRRERHYDRVEVTDLVALRSGEVPRRPVVTYVPRPVAIERYETARDRGAAAIEQRYWDLVDGAFAALGQDRLDRYRRTTPAPDVPVLPVVRERIATN